MIMEELTIEQKAKAYDEAIERIREWSETKNGYYMPKELCEEIFPELKENEDEKIRKALLRFHKSTIDIDGIKGGDILAWLEKQGDTFTKKDVDDAYLKGISDAKQEIEKQSEQKPLFKKGDTVFWDGEEFDILDVTKDSYDVDGYIIPICRQNELLLKQKPTDKVEPKFHKGDIIKPKDGGHEPWQIMQVDISDKKYRFKDGYVIHFSQEDDYELVEQKNTWSEEDEDYINDLIRYFSQNERLKNTKEDIVIWLKSLRPQNRWKPSDEQIRTLDFAIDCTVYPEFNIHRSVLKELLEQLKKLRKE